jgi:RNA-directed DNA polymerase
MLANLYMNRFLKYWRITERGSRFRAEVVNYADDFVILYRTRLFGHTFVQAAIA